MSSAGQGAASTKSPPRTPTRSSGRSPALWQIFFDEKDEQKVPESRDMLGKYVRIVDATDDEVYNSADFASHRHSNKGSAVAAVVERNGTTIGSPEGATAPPDAKGAGGSPHAKQNGEVDIVIHDKRRALPGGDGTAAQNIKPYSEHQWETVEMSNAGSARYNTRNKQLLRTDSDLELALPASKYDKWQVRCRYCCINCKTYPIDWSYLLVIAVALLLIVVYLVLVLLIWQAFWS